MAKYYSNKQDFTSSSGASSGNYPRYGGVSGTPATKDSGKTIITNTLEDIEEVAKVVSDEGLSDLYVQTGEASLGKDMPSSTFTKAYDRASSMLSSATRVHEEVMQRIDGKFTKGADNSLLSLNEVNGSQDPYSSDAFTYQKDNVSYDDMGRPIHYTTTERYTLSELLDGRTSPISASQTIYQNRLDRLRTGISEANGYTAEEVTRYQGMGDEELMSQFYVLGATGDYSGLKYSQWQEDNKEWLEPVEQYLGIALLAVALVATVVTAGAASPTVVATASVVATSATVTGTTYTAVNGGYSAVTGNTLISGTGLDTDDRYWAAAEAIVAVGTLGTGRILSFAGASDDVINASRTAAGYVDDTTGLAHTGYDAIVNGEDPTLGLLTFFGGRMVDGVASHTGNNASPETAVGMDVQTPKNTSTDAVSTSTPDIPKTDVEHVGAGEMSNNSVQSNQVSSSDVDSTFNANGVGSVPDLPQNNTNLSAVNNIKPASDSVLPKTNEVPDMSEVNTVIKPNGEPDASQPALVGATPKSPNDLASATVEVPRPNVTLDTTSRADMPNSQNPNDIELPSATPHVGDGDIPRVTNVEGTGNSVDIDLPSAGVVTSGTSATVVKPTGDVVDLPDASNKPSASNNAGNDVKPTKPAPEVSNKTRTVVGSENKVPEARIIPGEDGIVTGGDSTKLGRNMMQAMGLPRSTKWTGYQAQHIIPGGMADHPVIQAMGMDLDDASNGMFLPTPDESISPLSRHRGYHSTYNDFVESKLDNIDVNQSPAELQAEVKDLQRKLRILQEKGLPLYPHQGATIELWERFMANIE